MSVGVGLATAIRDGGHDAQGRPYDRPLRGRVYRITDIYPMRYGLGCTLEGMDPRPYRGYFLFVKPRYRGVEPGWYFEKLEKADDDFIEFMRRARTNTDAMS